MGVVALFDTVGGLRWGVEIERVRSAEGLGLLVDKGVVGIGYRC